jgi:hypothetical protein
MKRDLLQPSVLAVLAQLCHDVDKQLVLNTLWLWKNLAYKSDQATKTLIMQHLGWDTLQHAMQRDDALVQEQALSVLRNLVFGDDKEVDCVLKGFGAHHVLHAMEAQLETSKENVVIEQALLVLCNVCTVSDAYCNLVAQSETILMTVLSQLVPPSVAMTHVI